MPEFKGGRLRERLGEGPRGSCLLGEGRGNWYTWTAGKLGQAFVVKTRQPKSRVYVGFTCKSNSKVVANTIDCSFSYLQLVSILIPKAVGAKLNYIQKKSSQFQTLSAGVWSLE
jgi:hypothetical protein